MQTSLPKPSFRLTKLVKNQFFFHTKDYEYLEKQLNSVDCEYGEKVGKFFGFLRLLTEQEDFSSMPADQKEKFKEHYLKVIEKYFLKIQESTADNERRTIASSVIKLLEISEGVLREFEGSSYKKEIIYRISLIIANVLERDSSPFLSNWTTLRKLLSFENKIYIEMQN